MTEHESVRSLLALSTSGDLSSEEARRVRRHLADCEECRRTADEFGLIAEALRALPTPQPSPQLVARVQEITELRLRQVHAGDRESRLVAPLVVASWIAAALTWPLARDASYWLLHWWRIPAGDFTGALTAYSAAGLLLASMAAIAVGARARTNGRTK